MRNDGCAQAEAHGQYTKRDAGDSVQHDSVQAVLKSMQ
jgi:hypothetical protein